MKVPKSRHSIDSTHYSPYPPTSQSPHFSRPALPNRQSSHTPLTPTLASAAAAAGGASPTSAAGGRGGGGAEYKVARAISSCTRCRTRKQKCDGKLPACTACEKANVECIGFDAISKTNVSRNYLHSLEQEIASLRAQVAALTSPTSDPIGSSKRDIAAAASSAVSSFSRSDIPIDPALTGDNGSWDSSYASSQRRYSDYPSTPSDSPRSPFFGSRTHPTGQNVGINSSSLTRMVHDAASRTGHASNPVPIYQAPGSNASGSEKGSVIDSPIVAPDGVGVDSLPEASVRQGRRGTISAPSAPPSVGSSKKRRTFSVPPLPPQSAVERLVAAYVDFVGVTAPIIHIPSLGKQLLKIREGNNVEESDIFVVMMVLALSTMASSRFVDPPDELRACSEAFHAEAMKHLDAVFEEQSYVGLQAILLLVWYSLLNPDKGSIWFLVGLATRTCVDLGFHNEHNTQVEQLDKLELDMRRRLFWCTYKMDRLLSQSLGRPPSIPDGFISVPLPSNLHDVDIHPDEYGPLTGEACSYKAVFLHTIKFRQLQSEILFMTYGIHGNTGRLPTQEWFDDCYQRLKTWLATAPEPRGTVSTEGYAISFHNCSLLLFRPSPGSPRPGRQALSTVLSSSSYIIRIYRRMQLNDRISWLWMTSHFSFMAGLSLLYSFFNLYSTGGGPNVPTIEDAMMDIDSCMAVLDYLSPRVPSASACHDTLRKLSKAIFDQLSKLDPPDTSTSASSGLSLRGAPISSSREDPLPYGSFPTPLPPVELPYELSLLDNLFRNPMASHNKASEYTSNKCNKKKATVNGAKDGGAANAHEPTGFPPNAFHTQSNGGAGPPETLAAASRSFGDPHSLTGPYGMAAQVGLGTNGTSPQFTSSSNTNGNSSTHSHSRSQSHSGIKLTSGGVNGTLPMMGPPQQGRDHASSNMISSSGAGGGGGTMDPQSQSLPTYGGVGSGGVGELDIFSFLMDEEGLGLGGGAGWDVLDVPADFSLWS